MNLAEFTAAQDITSLFGGTGVDGELALGQFGGVAGRAAWLEVAGR